MVTVISKRFMSQIDIARDIVTSFGRSGRDEINSLDKEEAVWWGRHSVRDFEIKLFISDPVVRNDEFVGGQVTEIFSTSYNIHDDQPIATVGSVQKLINGATSTTAFVESLFRGDDVVKLVKLEGYLRQQMVFDTGDGDDQITVQHEKTQIYGGRGDDKIVAKGGKLSGDGGNDVIVAEEGHIFGGRGNDIIEGGTKAYGGNGNDNFRKTEHAFGEGGNDRFTYVERAYGGAGNDFMEHVVIGHGGAGNDVMWGRALFGEAGNDVLTTDSRFPIHVGRAGIDGGAGNDTIIVRGGTANRVAGGQGADTFIFEVRHTDSTIVDFNPRQRGERIDLSFYSGIKDFDDLIENHAGNWLVNGRPTGDSHISVGSGWTKGLRLTLDGVNVEELRADDFIF